MKMHRTGLLLVAMVGALLVLTRNLTAAPLFSENFSYANGELVSVSGGNWASVPTTDSNFVESGVLHIDDVATGKDYSRTFGATLTTGIVYAGFDLKVSDTDGPSSSVTDAPYFTFFSLSASNPGSSRLILNDGTTAGTYKIGIARGGGAGATTTFWAVELTEGQTYHVVQGYDLDSDVATLWINPTAIGSTNVTSSTGTGNPSSLGFFNTRVDTTADGEKYLDNLVVSQTFGDVVPEPTSLGLVTMVATVLLARRRAD